MSTPDPHDALTDESKLLARARAGLSPSPADALRVRASLAAALAAPGEIAREAPASASGAGQGLGTGQGWPLRVLLASATAAAIGAGAGGYWMGHRAGAREARQATLDTATHMVMHDGVRRPGPAATAETDAPSPAFSAPGPAVGVGTSAPEAVRRRSAASVRAARPAATVPSPESLEHEVRALRAVERALRDDDPRLALALLRQLDRDVPKGKLVEERQATTVIARCSAGDVPFGVNLAEDFASDYPDSVYQGRVEQSCQSRGRGK